MLEGLKVVEFSTYVAGPSAAATLADWGAEVVKVESAAGDPTRHILAGLPELRGNPVFEFENRGKRGVVLDTGKPEGREALIAILKGADVFITNLRPGGLKRARIDYDSLKDALPGLVYVSVSGYGLQGEGADLPAFDMAALWTRAGMAGSVIPEGVEPFFCRPGMGDAICALATASATLAACLERTRTGRGRLVETSLMRTGVYALGWDMSMQLKYGTRSPAQPRKKSLNPASNYFRSSDNRWFCVMVRRPEDFAALTRAVGHPHLADDPRFATPPDRAANNTALVEALDDAFGAMTMAEACQALADVDLVWAPLQTLDDVAADPLAHAAGCFIEVEDRLGDRFLAPAGPARFPGAADQAARRAPGHGEHTREVLAEAGYADADIDALISAGAAI